MAHPARSTDCREYESALYRRWQDLRLPFRLPNVLTGQRIDVLSIGRRNTRSGPDFLDALLLVDGKLVSGPVEMHLEEEDWFRHGHHTDPAYRSVRLHVIGNRTTYRNKLRIPTVHLDAGEEAPGSRYRAGSIVEDSGIPFSISSLADLRTTLYRASWERLLRRTSRYSTVDTDARYARLVVSLFDALGYGGNRESMRRVAGELLRQGIPESPVDLVRIVRRVARLPTGSASAFGRIGIDASLETPETVEADRSWRFDVRPGNRPDIRLVGGAVLLHRIASAEILEYSMADVLANNISSLLHRWTVTAGTEVFIGAGRSLDIIVNVLLPYLLAGAIHESSTQNTSALLGFYRRLPTTSSNRRLRDFERRYCNGNRLRGAFLQQGALECVDALNRRTIGT